MKGISIIKTIRLWRVFWSQIWWSGRFYSLGFGCNIYRALQVNNPKAVAIGKRVTLLKDFVIADLLPGEGTLPKITIGDDCMIMYRFQCNATRSVQIGNHVLIASNVLITDSDHVIEAGGVPVTRNGKFITQPVRIGNNCWIGQNAVILKGVTIGDHCIIGANSVVTHDVPSGCVAAGSPARVIKKSLPEVSSST